MVKAVPREADACVNPDWCMVPEEVERENYLEAVAEKYRIGFENLRKLVAAYAAQTGLAL